MYAAQNFWWLQCLQNQSFQEQDVFCDLPGTQGKKQP